MASSDPELSYRHERDEQRLKDAVSTVKRTQHIGAKKLIAEFQKQHQPLDGETELHLSTFNKWLRHKANIRLSVLIGLHAWIKTHPHYGQYLPDAVERVTERPSTALEGVELLSHALNEYFSGPATAVQKSAAPKLAGRYLLYRAGWIGDAEGTFRTSLITVTPHEGYTEITEVQDYPKDRPPYYQEDAGALFAYGPHVYGLFWETGGTSCVKLMVITGTFEQDSRANHIDRFQGYLLAASTRGVFRRIAFVCYRTAESAPALGRVTATDIPDFEAVAFLLADDPTKIVTGYSGPS